MFNENQDLEVYNGTAGAVTTNDVTNPFGTLTTSQSVGTAQVVSHELAEMQAQIYLAKQFPRDQRKATDQILTACQRPGLASVAVYSYARGGSSISGPSIRLAEEICRDWGNIECGWNELERLEDSSKLRAFAWDKETNVLKTLFFFVPHYRSTKAGRKRITDERDLYELLANQAARRMRNCILALIPGDVVDAAVAQCERTMVTSCEINSETIKKLVEAFSAFGVTKRQIETRIQRNLDSITPAQFVRMREIYTSLKDGISEPSDWFEASEENPAATATETLKDALKKTGKVGRPRKQAPTMEPAAMTQSENASKQEANQETAQEAFYRQIFEAPDVASLRDLAGKITNSDTMTQEEKDGLHHLIDQRAMDFE